MKLSSAVLAATLVLASQGCASDSGTDVSDSGTDASDSGTDATTDGGAETEGVTHSNTIDHTDHETDFNAGEHWATHGHSAITDQSSGDAGAGQGTSSPVDPPTRGSVAIYASNVFEGVDGPILYAEADCTTPDDGTCQDGWGVCPFYDECANKCYRDRSCGSNHIHRDSIEDPCGLWYLDKSSSDAVYLRAKNSYVEEVLSFQSVQFLANGEAALGVTDCVTACRDDDDCVGGYYSSVQVELPTECRLLYKSPKELAPAGEAYVFRAAGGASELNDIADFYALFFLNQGYFSKCEAP